MTFLLYCEPRKRGFIKLILVVRVRFEVRNDRLVQGQRTLFHNLRRGYRETIVNRDENLRKICPSSNELSCRLFRYFLENLPGNLLS